MWDEPKVTTTVFRITMIALHMHCTADIIPCESHGKEEINRVREVSSFHCNLTLFSCLYTLNGYAFTFFLLSSPHLEWCLEKNNFFCSSPFLIFDSSVPIARIVLDFQTYDTPDQISSSSPAFSSISTTDKTCS